jgi:molecular chaperone DnaJ
MLHRSNDGCVSRRNGLDVDDSYKELGLTAGASDAEIKAAWRRLAARWHPDRNHTPQALKKIQRINRALEEIRKSRGNGIAGQEEHGARPRRTIDHTVALTLEEAITGCAKDIQGEVVDECVECGGSGVEAHVRPCHECDGAGRIRRHLWFGWMPSLAECSACAGHGVTRHACGACEGTGKQAPRKYHCHVQFPPGTREGDVVQALARVQGDSQKLAVQVRAELQPHELFELQADGTVTCEMPVDGFAWTANRWIQVPTPAGLRQMKLKRGHLVYRIRGEGFPRGEGGSAADCMVTVVPLFPEDFSQEQEALIDGLIATNSGARSTDAGTRMRGWNEVVGRWEGHGR